MTVEYLTRADGNVTVLVMAYVGDKALLRAEVTIYVRRATAGVK